MYINKNRLWFKYMSKIFVKVKFTIFDSTDQIRKKKPCSFISEWITDHIIIDCFLISKPHGRNIEWDL